LRIRPRNQGGTKSLFKIEVTLNQGIIKPQRSGAKGGLEGLLKILSHGNTRGGERSASRRSIKKGKGSGSVTKRRLSKGEGGNTK